MDTRIVVGIGVVVLVVALVVFGPGLARTYARNAKLSECEALKQRLAAATAQGTDVTQIQALQDQINACAQDAESYGADLDLGTVALQTCDAFYEKMEREFTHYRSTSYDDPVKRNNTRQAILRMGEELVRCYQGAIAQAESTGTIDQIKRSILRTLAAATSRRDCYQFDQTGCGRFAVNEDHGNDKAAAEQSRIIDPLNRVLTDELSAKRAQLASSRSPSILRGSGLTRVGIGAIS